MLLSIHLAIYLPSINLGSGIYILAISPPKVKNREEFEGGLEKRKGKGGKRRKKKRVIKHTLKFLYEA